MSANQFMNRLTEALDSGDRLMINGRNAEAIQVFEEIVSLFREMESVQQETHEGGPTQVPLSLRMIVLHRDISVPLHRLGNAHLRVGDYDTALDVAQRAPQRDG